MAVRARTRSTATGWAAKPEGLRRGQCVFRSPQAGGSDVRSGRRGMNLAALWWHLGEPGRAERQRPRLGPWRRRATTGPPPWHYWSRSDFVLPDAARDARTRLSDYGARRSCSSPGPLVRVPPRPARVAGAHEELADRNFVVIAVAMDSREGDPLPWIAAANPTYPGLIDRALPPGRALRHRQRAAGHLDRRDRAHRAAWRSRPEPTKASAG